MSSDTSENCLNLNDILDANCFLTSLFSIASHLILEVTERFPTWPNHQSFESCLDHAEKGIHDAESVATFM